MDYMALSAAEWQQEYDKVSAEYESWKAKGLKLNMARGKPSKQQLDLVSGILTALTSAEECVDSGVDARNYGELKGLESARKLFADILGCKTSQVFAGGNSSLQLMYDTVSKAYTHGLLHSEKPWCKEESVKWLCPAPGYDRHFKVTENFGFELITIPMTENGPDMDIVENLIKDPSVKGMWCVPKYSNPDGITYSDETVRRFARLAPAAPDFRVFWDEAYIVHSFSEEDDQLLNIFDEAGKCGTLDHFLIFTSTSKITFPGSGVAVMAASDRNIAFTKSKMTYQTIGYDKLNMMRHVKFFGSADGIREHMKKHAAIIRPKFEAVLSTFDRELSGKGIAEWTKPIGGYFLSLNVMDGCAKRVFELCAGAGVTLTDVGATFPYKNDPRDRNLRIAPTFPTAEEMAVAASVLCVCVKLAALEKLA